MEQVTRTRILRTDVDDRQPAADAHAAAFAAIRPVATILPAARFVDPNSPVEPEVDAAVPD